ncbi:MAG: cysteine--tRNA ligase [Firmicutes bacterium]|nr:cysteine--tRNA ligase [Bacillota bacterium]
MALKIYNTMTRRKEEFTPREDNKVGIYVCGVTPYSDTHLGHALPSVLWDVFRRFLRYRGYDVTLVQNFTDIDDKIIARANKEGVPAQAIARRYAQDYLESMDALGVERADHYPLVSEHIPHIIDMVQTLIDKGFAYVEGGDVYFSVEKFPSYGRLSRQRLEDLVEGESAGEGKRHPVDFALWKAAKPGEPSWDSPWGPGRPGWHIECSAMSLHYLGNCFDFHGGGVDLIFPHHENEIAQSEAYTGEEPFVRYWLHNGLIKIKDAKMSKSLGNFVTVKELLAEHPPELIRFFLLSAHYRSPLEYHEDKLAEVRRGWERLNSAYKTLTAAIAQEREADGEVPSPMKESLQGALKDCREGFIGAMEDDFNTALAIAALFDLARETNTFLAEAQPPYDAEALELLREAAELFRVFGGEILGIVQEPGPAGDDKLVQELLDLVIELRSQARARRDFATADAIRDRLREMGIALEDTSGGVRWRWL